MKGFNLSKALKSLKLAAGKHSPEILTGVGITGMIGACIMAVKVTPKALRLVNDFKEQNHIPKEENPPIKETIKATWKCYVPAAVTMTGSVICLIGSCSINTKRNATLATALSLTGTAFSEYKDKVVETIGEKKEREIKDKVAAEVIEKDPVTNHEVILSEKGNTLCYDTISGRYFKSDIDIIKRAENELNRELVTDVYAPLNDFYYKIGLAGIYPLGEDIGWNMGANGFLNIDFSSQLAADGTPCLVINYNITPKYDFTALY